MPTAPKLAALFWYALVGWFTAQLVIPYLPDGSQIGNMLQVSAGFGGFVGWTFAGKRAGDSMRAAYGFGLTAIFLLVLYSVFYFSFEEMIRRALRKRYDGPIHALTNSVALMGENFLLLLKWDVVIVLVFGGLFGGWIVEKVGRKWS